MKNAYTFSKQLQIIMSKHKLSATNLATMIGSRADLKHILTDDGTANKRNSLYEKLKTSKLFDEDDYACLERSLEVSRLGLERYRFQKAVASVLTGEPIDGDSEMYTDKQIPLSARFALLMEADKIEIICFNSCYYALFAALKPLFENTKRDIALRHYLSYASNENSAAEYVASVMPLIYDPRYYSYIRNAASDEHLPCVAGNTVFIRANINNQSIEYCFVVVDASTAYELPNASDCRLFGFVDKILQSSKPEPIALKEAYPHEQDFPALCMTFLSHELNRATYSLSNELHFQQTPTDIAIAAFSDKGIESDADTQRIIERTLSIHEQRYQNQYHKKKHTYRIMTTAGCENFLKTGMFTDHFMGFRPFTPEERKTIFKNMLVAARENTYFIPLLLKESSFSHQNNLVCYEKLGVSLDAKDTDYNISNGYRSVFLMYPAFTKLYMNYYLDILVKEKCFSREESMIKLEQLYQTFLAEFQLQA